MKKLLSLAAIAVLTACGQAPNENTNSTQAAAPAAVQKAQSETERLNEWFEAKYEEQLLRSPMTLTRLGRKERYDEFDDFTEAASEKQLKWQEQSVAELKSQFDYDKLTEDAKISYDIWVYQYEAAKAQQPYQRRAYVFTQMLGAHANLPNFLINFHRVDDVSDMQAYIKRISGLAKAISQLLERAKVNAGEGVRPPYFAYEGVIEQSSNILRGNPFEESVNDSPSGNAPAPVACLGTFAKSCVNQLMRFS